MYAFVFPGQGSQRPGMGEAWQDTPWWSRVEQLSEVTGRDVGHLLTGADAGELKSTRNAQLATFGLSLVILDAARQSLGHHQPAVVAGHSLGEYTALVAAAVLDPEHGARLVAERGEAMESAAAANPGTMAAVLGLDPGQVASACQDVAGAWVANDNAPGQIVIAGTASGVEQAAARARELGAKKVVPLAVSGAFHTPLMAPAQGRLNAALQAAPFGHAEFDCVANVDAAPHSDPSSWPGLLADQLCSRVRWRETMLCLADLGVTTFVELGPGAELSGMVKRTVAAATRANVAVPDDLAELSATVHDRG